MMKSIYALALSGLIAGGALAPPTGRSEAPARPFSIGAVLKAHNIPIREPDALANTFAEAVKLTSNRPDVGPESPSFFEWTVSVYTQGTAFKRRKVDSQGLREQIDLFDGRLAYHFEFERGNRLPEEEHVGASRFDAVELGVRTFGLLPVLRQLSDVSTRVVHMGRTTGGQNWFRVAAATGEFFVYSDRRHLIRRAEFGDMTIEYAGYREVGGARLPFIQRVTVGKRLIYELVFTQIDLNHQVPEDYLSPDRILAETDR